MAKSGTNMFLDFVVFYSPLNCILDQLRLDALGIVYCRHCCSSTITLYFLSFILFQLSKKKKGEL